MNWNFTIDRARDLICVFADGHLGEDELVLGHACITSVPEFHPRIRVLHDFRRVTTVSVRAERLLELARHPAFSIESKRAFVTPPGMARSFFDYHSLHASPGPSKAFDTMDEALAWLDNRH